MMKPYIHYTGRMEKQTQNDIWYKLILNPGKVRERDAETGLDARLLENMIDTGVIPKDILQHEIELGLDDMRLQGPLNLDLPDWNTSIARGLYSQRRRKIKTPVWIPWLCRRAGKNDDKSAHQAICLMHKLGLVPWGKKTLEETGLNIYGLDIIFPLCWDDMRHNDKNTILDLALSEAPKEDIEALRDRTMDHCRSWEASAKRARHVEQFHVMNKHGLWSNNVREGLANDTFETFNTKELIETAFEAGGNHIVAKIQVAILHGKETMEVRRELLEKIDQDLDQKMGRKTRSSAIDKLINNLMIGSSSVDGDFLGRAISKNKTTHRGGVGLGMAVLGAVDRASENRERIIEAIESRGQAAPEWESWKAQEAKGMEGSGVLEGDCLMAARIVGGSFDNGVPTVEQFEGMVNKLDKQAVLLIPWGKIRSSLSGTNLWKNWAMDTEMGAGTISGYRNKAGHDEQDVWLFENLVSQDKYLTLSVYTHENPVLSQKLMLSHGNMLRAAESKDWEMADLWACRSFEKWASLLITSCLVDMARNDEGWKGKDPGMGIEGSLTDFDPIEVMRQIPNCHRTRRRFDELIDFLDRPLSIDKSEGYRANRYLGIEKAKDKISAMEYISAYSGRGREFQEDIQQAQRASTIIKRFYLMAKQYINEQAPANDQRVLSQPKM